METVENASAEPIAVRLIGTVFRCAVATITRVAKSGAVCTFFVQPPKASTAPRVPSKIVSRVEFLFIDGRVPVFMQPVETLNRGRSANAGILPNRRSQSP